VNFTAGAGCRGPGVAGGVSCLGCGWVLGCGCAGCRRFRRPSATARSHIRCQRRASTAAGISPIRRAPALRLRRRAAFRFAGHAGVSQRRSRVSLPGCGWWSWVRFQPSRLRPGRSLCASRRSLRDFCGTFTAGAGRRCGISRCTDLRSRPDLRGTFTAGLPWTGRRRDGISRRPARRSLPGRLGWAPGRVPGGRRGRIRRRPPGVDPQLRDPGRPFEVGRLRVHPGRNLLPVLDRRAVVPTPRRPALDPARRPARELPPLLEPGRDRTRPPRRLLPARLPARRPPGGRLPVPSRGRAGRERLSRGGRDGLGLLEPLRRRCQRCTTTPPVASPPTPAMIRPARVETT
jgi:hypothetical protein